MVRLSKLPRVTSCHRPIASHSFGQLYIHSSLEGRHRFPSVGFWTDFNQTSLSIETKKSSEIIVGGSPVLLISSYHGLIVAHLDQSPTNIVAQEYSDVGNVPPLFHACRRGCCSRSSEDASKADINGLETGGVSLCVP